MSRAALRNRHNVVELHSVVLLAAVGASTLVSLAKITEFGWRGSPSIVPLAHIASEAAGLSQFVGALRILGAPLFHELRDGSWVRFSPALLSLFVALWIVLGPLSGFSSYLRSVFRVGIAVLCRRFGRNVVTYRACSIDHTARTDMTFRAWLSSEIGRKPGVSGIRQRYDFHGAQSIQMPLVLANFTVA